MVESRARRVRGVALIVRSPRDWREVLVIQELESKPQLGKYTGMFSIPMETSRLGESDVSALSRLMEEELPGLGPHVTVERERRGIYRITRRVWVSLYGAVARTRSLPSLPTAEVGGYSWMDVGDVLRLWLRQGAREMLADYIARREAVLCRKCKSASATPPE